METVSGFNIGNVAPLPTSEEVSVAQDLYMEGGSNYDDALMYQWVFYSVLRDSLGYGEGQGYGLIYWHIPGEGHYGSSDYRGDGSWVEGLAHSWKSTANVGSGIGSVFSGNSENLSFIDTRGDGCGFGNGEWTMFGMGRTGLRSRLFPGLFTRLNPMRP
jgi:hypothetical protein